MKKTKILSLLLSLSLFGTLIAPGTIAHAEVEPKSGSGDNGMKISKTATANPDGTYTITLEAYATGKRISTEVTKDVPTDIVLVLDQSGSMSEEDFPSVGTTTYTAYNDTRNSSLYSKRHNNTGNKGNLYYPLSDGSYATVSVTRTRGESTNNYTQCDEDWKNYTTSIRDDDYWKYSNNLYVKNEAGVYQKVIVEYDSTGEFWNRVYVYTYTFPNGNVVTSDGNDGQPGLNNFDGNGPVYYLSGTTPGEYTYTYTCTDADGSTINIGTSTGENNNFTGATLYSRTVTNGGNITRLQALKNAVTGFNNSVAQKAAGKDGVHGTDDDVDHRIAVVGFAARKDTNPGNYINTELFIGENEYKYGDDAQGQYTKAFQNMKTEAGQKNVTKSIDALDAYGGTHIDLGMEMAKGILDNNPVLNGEKRNRVVIVFTDGSPGSGSWTNSDMTYAKNAINYANTLRSSSVNVYTVGIFNGADATSAGKQDGNDTQKANWFMQNLSDNKGTPQTPSYYLSAANSNTLNNIFKQIADNIESGGSATTLDKNAVIKDIISPQFQLSAGATADKITLETYKYINENQWEKNTDAMSATATVNGDQVNVTGFDFSENWCGTETTNGKTTYRGNKLVISFKVQPKAGFLGGNGVPTNTSAGIYENANAQEPVMTFPVPTVNVPIKDVTVNAQDKNVYLLGNVPADQLKNGAEVSVGGVALDLSQADQNYGLQPWQTEYVDIAVKVKDKDGNPISDKLDNLTKDTTYTIEVTVKPNKDGKSSSGTPATEQFGKNTPAANINVFKPELTFKDSTAYYGDNVPTSNDYSSNRVGEEKWMHGDTASTDTGVTMLGSKPMLNIIYTPEASKLNSGKYTKQDVPVSATVKIGTTDVNQYTKFAHQDCTENGCSWTDPTATPGNPAFLIHVKTCTLEIKKTGGAKDESYVFDVYKGNEKYSEVTIEGNGTQTLYELPVGTYTIKENEGWSWRYTPRYSGNAVLNADTPTGSITCTNTKTNDQWLNGFSKVVRNIYGNNG